MLKSACILFAYILLSLGLSACSPHSKAVNSYSTNQQPGPGNRIAAGAIGGTVIGGVTGAGIATAAGTNVLAGGVIGAGVGASIGVITAFQKQQAQYDRLTRDGVRVIALGDIIEITIPSDKLFYPNEANLTYASLPILEDTLTFINTYGDVHMNISAHGDTTGTLQHSLALTKLQAQSVMTYFWTHGKPLDTMNFYGMNHQEAIADQDTAYGEYFNRRIEIMFWQKATS